MLRKEGGWVLYQYWGSVWKLKTEWVVDLHLGLPLEVVVLTQGLVVLYQKHFAVYVNIDKFLENKPKYVVDCEKKRKTLSGKSVTDFPAGMTAWWTGSVICTAVCFRKEILVYERNQMSDHFLSKLVPPANSIGFAGIATSGGGTFAIAINLTLDRAVIKFGSTRYDLTSDTLVEGNHVEGFLNGDMCVHPYSKEVGLVVIRNEEVVNAEGEVIHVYTPWIVTAKSDSGCLTYDIIEGVSRKSVPCLVVAADYSIVTTNDYDV